MTKHPGTFIAGVFYTLFGILALLEVLDLWSLSAAAFWPLLLIAIGAAVIAGAHVPEDDD